jgi:glutamine amidotransferase
LIAILDYGSGNIRSAQRAFEKTKHQVIVTSDYQEAVSADGLVVPGVGAFGSCMKALLKIDGDKIIKERQQEKKKTLGICVGMQILFETGDELLDGESIKGLGIFPGRVVRLEAPVIPHMGFNEVKVDESSKLFQGIEKERFYFVHSYAAKDPVDGANSYCDYGGGFLAAIESQTVSAVQFHPEKSGAAGLALIENWASTL